MRKACGKTFLLNPSLRSSVKVKVKYQGHNIKKWALQGHSCFTNTSCFENVVGKGENAGTQDFLLFLQCFQPYQRQSSFNFSI